ncbi:MAG: hypothetical protein Kow00127_25500 [Bacteroidales bacterium]
MKDLFKTIDLKEFEGKFDTEEKCLEFLAEQKWKDGFVCRKCGHTNWCKGKKAGSRRCTRCKTEESATAHTMYHKCKFPLTTAFRITYMVCHQPGLTTSVISELTGIRQMTCWKFRKKIESCIDQRGDIDILQKVALKKEIGGLK